MDKIATFEDISVLVFKEGDRSLQVKIPLRVHLAHAQSGWLSFLNRIKHELEIEDIDGVYEDANGAPVVRIASLVDDGLYFVRPTEVCAMLRSLVRTEPERCPAWPSVEEGLEAKRELARCQEYYEHKLLPMSWTSGEAKVVSAEETVPDPSGGAFVWAMRVKQGFKCKVYGAPECDPNAVSDVIPMGTVITLSTDWGEALEEHRLRGQGKGNVLRVIDPQDGFVERRPLEDVGEKEMSPATAATTETTTTVPTAFTNKDRMEVIRGAASMSEILRTTLRRGAYFKGAMGVHHCVEVHRAALRAAATMMRKDPLSREELLECRGIELFSLIIRKFCEDRFLSEYGCWAIAVFAGEGNASAGDARFQDAATDAGVLEAVRAAIDAHRESAPLRRHGVGALVAVADGNASSSGKLRALHLHVDVAEDSLRRWPNDAELSCLSCWMLQSAIEPPSLNSRRRKPPRSVFPEGGVVVGDTNSGWVGGRESVSTFGHENSPLQVVTGAGGRGEGGGGGEGGDFALPNGLPNGDTASRSGSAGGFVAGDSQDALLAEVGVEAGDFVKPNGGNRGRSSSSSSARGFIVDASRGTVDDNWSYNTVGSGGAPLPLPGGRCSKIRGVADAAGSGEGGGGGFETGDDDETSDILICLDDDAIETAGDGDNASTRSELGGVTPAAVLKTTIPKTDSAEHLATSTHSKNVLLGGEGNNRQERVMREEAEEVSTTKNAGLREGEGGGAVSLAEVRGEEDEEVLERLLELAEATKVVNHDNESTRKAAAALVDALLRQLEASYAASSRRRRRASRGRVTRVLKVGQALGSL